MALELPLHGEEVLSLNWSGALEDKAQLDGDFYRRILFELKNKPQAKSLMKVFLLKTAQIIAARESLVKNTQNFKCEQAKYDQYKDEKVGTCAQSKNNFNFQWFIGKNYFELEIPIATRYIYKIRFQNLNNQFFSEMNATLLQRDSGKNLFSLKLFLESCTAK